MDWFLYDMDLQYERVLERNTSLLFKTLIIFITPPTTMQDFSGSSNFQGKQQCRPRHLILIFHPKTEERQVQTFESKKNTKNEENHDDGDDDDDDDNVDRNISG